MDGANLDPTSKQARLLGAEQTTPQVSKPLIESLKSQIQNVLGGVRSLSTPMQSLFEAPRKQTLSAESAKPLELAGLDRGHEKPSQEVAQAARHFAEACKHAYSGAQNFQEKGITNQWASLMPARGKLGREGGVKADQTVLELKRLGFEVTSSDSNITFYDTKTGVRGVLLENPEASKDGKTNYTIAFSGLGASHPSGRLASLRLQFSQLKACIGNIFGRKPKAYWQAEEAVRMLQDGLPEGSKVTVSGHSFGGSLAQYAALKCKLPAVVFNSLPVGRGLVSGLGSDAPRFQDGKPNEQGGEIQQFMTSGDWTSNKFILPSARRSDASIARAARGMDKLGQRLAQQGRGRYNFGEQRYVLDALGDKTAQRTYHRHNNFLFALREAAKRGPES